MRGQTSINNNQSIIDHINYYIYNQGADAKDASKLLYMNDEALRYNMNHIWLADLPFVLGSTILMILFNNIHGIMLPFYTLFLAMFIIRDVSKISNIWLKRVIDLTPFKFNNARKSKIKRIIAADRSSKFLISKILLLEYIPLIALAAYWSYILPDNQLIAYRNGSLIIIGAFIVLMILVSLDSNKIK